MIHISTKIVYHIFFQVGDTLFWQLSNFSPKFVVYLHLTVLPLCSVNHLQGRDIMVLVHLFFLGPNYVPGRYSGRQRIVASCKVLMEPAIVEQSKIHFCTFHRFTRTPYRQELKTNECPCKRCFELNFIHWRISMESKDSCSPSPLSSSLPFSLVTRNLPDPSFCFRKCSLCWQEEHVQLTVLRDFPRTVKCCEELQSRTSGVPHISIMTGFGG